MRHPIKTILLALLLVVMMASELPVLSARAEKNPLRDETDKGLKMVNELPINIGPHINTEKVIGEVMDLNHAMPYCPSKIKVRVGNYSDCKGARMVVIAAGANQKEGETRMDLIYKNASIFKSIISSVKENDFNGILWICMRTNPWRIHWCSSIIWINQDE